MSSSNEEVEVAYVPGEKVAVEDLLKRDAEDESLRLYKEKLLGASAKGVPKTDDPRKVIINKLSIELQGRDPVVFELSNKESIERINEKPVVIKEEAKFRFRIDFIVQHEIVSGLVYANQVYRGPLKVGSSDLMLGSYAPGVHHWSSPWETAPSGMFSRGSYKCKSKFADDDKQSHLEYEYTLDIKKDWQ